MEVICLPQTLLLRVPLKPHIYPKLWLFVFPKAQVTRKRSGLLSKPAHSLPSNDLQRKSHKWVNSEHAIPKPYTCTAAECLELAMLSRTAFNTPGALQDPVPTSLHFKKSFQRSSCSGHRVLEGTGSACKHVLCVLHVHCCELSRALHAQEVWKNWRTQRSSCDKAWDTTQSIWRAQLSTEQWTHHRTREDGPRRRRLDLMDEEYALIRWGRPSKGSSDWEGM